MRRRRYEGPERRLEHLPRYQGPERRRPRRAKVQLVRWLAILAVLAMFGALGGLFHQLQVEIDRAVQADNASEVERRIVSCTVRGVLELSAERARQRGELNEPVVLPDGTVTTTGALFRGVLSRLREDCPPLVVPTQTEPPAPGEDVPGRFPRRG
jgi:hypothetical protein